MKVRDIRQARLLAPPGSKPDAEPACTCARHVPTRRDALVQITSAALAPTVLGAGIALALEEQAVSAIREITRGAEVKPGRVSVVLPELAENGNTVALTVSVESPMTAVDHVTAIYIVSERNPVARVVSFTLGPRAGRAKVATNIRLATTQIVTALAEMSDGSFWSANQEVIVTLAACLDAG